MREPDGSLLPLGRVGCRRRTPPGIWADAPYQRYLWNPNHKSPVAEGDATRDVKHTSRVVGGRGVFTLCPLRSTGRNELLKQARPLPNLTTSLQARATPPAPPHARSKKGAAVKREASRAP